MQKEDWITIMKWMGYVYLPIALLIIFIFVMVEWNMTHIEKEKNNLSTIQPVTSSSSTPL
jgi:hypothetical protein